MTTTQRNHFLALLLVTALVAILSTGFLANIDEWRATHWLIDYKFEFTKRGLLGSLLYTASPHGIHIQLITYVSYLIYTLLFILLSYFIFSSLKTLPAVAGIILCSGFAIQQLGYDIGRFDQPILILTIISLMLLSNRRLSGTQYLSVLLLSLFSMVIHEGSALISIPLIFSALMVRSLELDKSFRLPAIYITTCISVFILVSITGGLANTTESTWIQHLQSKAIDFQVNLFSGGVPFNDLKANITLTIERLLTAATLSRFSLIALVSIPFVLLFMSIARGIKFSNSLTKYVLLLPTISILPLFALGIDFYRWVAIGMLNTALILAFAIRANIPVSIEISNKLLFACVVTLIYSGPYGISIALVNRGMLMEKILSFF